MSASTRVVVIGAARSGTKMLRDALAAASGAGVVPYDVGYVWRYGNEGLPDDVIAPEQISGTAREFIRRFVDGYAAGHPLAVVEKTVGNTMRVPAVAAVFPDAAFVHLIRDGVDVIESTRRQWTAPTDARYLLRKVRHFPMRLVPSYGVAYARSLAHRRRDPERRVGSWGPRYPGIDDDLRDSGLLTVCARQWRESVIRARGGLANPSLRSLEVRYERFVEDPNAELARIAEFSELAIDQASLVGTAESIRRDFRGAGRGRLSSAERQLLNDEVGPLLADLGYEPPDVVHGVAASSSED